MNAKPLTIDRPPVIAIMGHVDHGKSSLLDYIRKTNIVAGEAGGITQHLSAYEINYAMPDGITRRITFIDTPGHAAFSHMRHRGAAVADIAILIVSAEEGVKAQTIEAIKTIQSNKVPFVVAVNKIDRPNTNPERIKTELLEHGVYVEGYGGSVPVALISSKTGQGVSDLLDTLLLLADLEGFTGTSDKPAEGFVIEANLDEKRGVSAVLVIKDGTLSKGQFVVVGTALTTTRITEDFQGNNIDTATFSSPVRIVGFSELPEVGSLFETYATKKEAEAAIVKNKTENKGKRLATLGDQDGVTIIPVIIKSDVSGTLEAIEHEIGKLSTDDMWFKVIKKGIGSVNESDMQSAVADPSTIIVGFNVSIDRAARDMQGADAVTVKLFDIIYKLTEWLEAERAKRRPMKMVEKIIGRARILKVFSNTKGAYVAGGTVLEGVLKPNNEVRILHKDETTANGILKNVQKGKSNATSVEVDEEFGMMIETSTVLIPGDILEAIVQEES